MSEHTIEAQARAAVGPATAPRIGAPPVIDDAIMFVDDRQNRLDHVLDELGAMVARLTDRLTPVLTDGQPATYPSTTELAARTPIPEDRRSTIARRIHDFGLTADRQADTITERIQQLGGILDALEV